MIRRMSPPYVTGDRSKDWIKEDKVHIEVENACDFEEEDVFKDFQMIVIFFVIQDKVLTSFV